MTRSALVTGGSAGIGLSVVRALAADGYSVTAVARDPGRLASAVDGLVGVVGCVADAGDAAAIGDVVEGHVARHGGLDLVVANAGAGSSGSAARTGAEALEAMMRANVGGPFALAGAALPHLRRAAPTDPPAWFVVVASLSGEWPTPGFAAYSATKAAAVSLARSIAAEEAAKGVRACAICPAFVRTDMSSWARDRVEGPMLEPDDVAEAVRFLTRLSPAASVTELVLRRAGAGIHEP
jgi:NAD(P)-dependent dehydrogenase (short-subunit alcohol dehydrogenase family)